MSGWRPHLEGLRSLDLRQLIRLGAVVPDSSTSGSWRWSDSQTGETLATIGYSVAWSGGGGTLRLAYRVSGVEKDYAVPIEAERLHWGGLRYWLRCPVTHRRVRKLYLVQGMFVARTAIRPLPTYAIQRESRRDRNLSAQWAIRRKLGNPGSLLDPVMKPKWMRWATFERYRLRDAQLGERDEAFLMRLIGRMGNWQEGETAGHSTQRTFAANGPLDHLGGRIESSRPRHLRHPE